VILSFQQHYGELRKMNINEKEIWTIGHSNRSQIEFLNCLTSFRIEALVDVRRFAGSRKYPHFNVEALAKYLPESNIQYIQMPSLGGRRKPQPDSKNTVWRNEAFKGYADYTASEEYNNAIIELTACAHRFRTAYMCSEAVWWRCHRSIISDHLKEQGWKVMHIMKETLAKEHPYTTAFLETHPGYVRDM
jgi:uncharacterized protein (DUF488 family)